MHHQKQVPVYIAEISPKNLRGGLTTLNQLMIVIGASVSFMIGSLISWKTLALTGKYLEFLGKSLKKKSPLETNEYMFLVLKRTCSLHCFAPWLVLHTRISPMAGNLLYWIHDFIHFFFK